MTTDNRTNGPTPEQVEAAAKAMHARDLARSKQSYPDRPSFWAKLRPAYYEHARAALVAAQGAAPHRPVIDREELIDVLVMTDLSDYAGTDMRAISQCADAILAHLAADTGGQRDA